MTIGISLPSVWVYVEVDVTMCVPRARVPGLQGGTTWHLGAGTGTECREVRDTCPDGEIISWPLLKVLLSDILAWWFHVCKK